MVCTVNSQQVNGPVYEPASWLLCVELQAFPLFAWVLLFLRHTKDMQVRGAENLKCLLLIGVTVFHDCLTWD